MKQQVLYFAVPFDVMEFENSSATYVLKRSMKGGQGYVKYTKSMTSRCVAFSYHPTEWWKYEWIKLMHEFTSDIYVGYCKTNWCVEILKIIFAASTFSIRLSRREEERERKKKNRGRNRERGKQWWEIENVMGKLPRSIHFRNRMMVWLR